MSRHIIEGNLNGEMYRDILENELPTLLEIWSLEVWTFSFNTMVV